MRTICQYRRLRAARERRLRGQVAGGGMVPAGMKACQVTRMAMASRSPQAQLRAAKPSTIP